MKKVKAGFWILALGVGLVLMGAKATWAIGFTYYDSGIWTQWDGQVTNGISTDGFDTNRASGYYSVTGPSVSATVASGGSWTDGSTATVTMNATVSAYSSTAAGSVSAYSTAATVVPGFTTNIYFLITGGTTGTPVQVLYSWSASLLTGDGGSASFDGGFDPLAITVNDYPSSASPPHVWIHAPATIYSNDSLTDAASGTFMAYIGDIIGINLGVGASVDISGSGGFYAEANNTMNLGVQAVPVPGAAWLLGSGLMGLAGLRRFRKS
ncbi:MAG: VPLPA-CTERM sorting domain-containing protein [Desulfobaccales bacterium]